LLFSTTLLQTGIYWCRS